MILTPEDAPKGKRIIVCGGRSYGVPLRVYPNDEALAQDSLRIKLERQAMFDALDTMAPIAIAHGAASGADSIADEWAILRGVTCVRFPAKWNSFSRQFAGFKRNRFMFASFGPDGTLAAPGDNGTADMEALTLESRCFLARVPKVKWSEK